MYSVDKNKKELDSVEKSPYYGQWQTDKIIESYFDNKATGVCIEVGAANGIRGSNTKYFEDTGWTALCIEPNVAYKESLEASRKLVRFFACGDSNKEGTLHIFDIGEKNIYSSVTSLIPDQRLVDAHTTIINGREEVDVPVRTLNWVLETQVSNTPFENITDIDFISIDTEGTELDVVKGFDTTLYNVKLFIIENNYEDTEIEDYMNSLGYKKDKRYKINDFYIKEDTDGK